MSTPLGAMLALAIACGSPTPMESDGGSCDLTVMLGTGDARSFTQLVDDDPAELILGFQGFRMLQFAIDVAGPASSQAEVSAFVTIGDIELSQRTRERALGATAEGFVVEDWLVFFNDTPAASLVGQPAEIEVIVRAEGCVGGARARVLIRDDDQCIDQTIVLDAGSIDAGVTDAMACEDM